MQIKTMVWAFAEPRYRPFFIKYVRFRTYIFIRRTLQSHRQNSPSGDVDALTRGAVHALRANADVGYCIRRHYAAQPPEHVVKNDWGF